MLKNYLLTAWKVFLRRKLFTAINLLCIVLALVVLMVATALLEHAFSPSGVEGKSGRFLQVLTMSATTLDGNMQRDSTLGYKVIDKYLKPMRSVETVAVLTLPRSVSVYQEGRVSELEMRRADANYWKVLDFNVLAGRLPTRDDEDKGRFVAVLNASSADKLFPGVPAVGQKVSAGGQLFEIIGVVEDALHLNAYADIWAPLTTLPSTAYTQQSWGDFTALLLAASPEGLPAIRKEVEMVAKTVELEGPQQWGKPLFWADSKLDIFARMTVGRKDSPDSGAGTLLAIIVVAMLVFMLLPALNLVNLNKGRIMERSAEIGVRKAFGATNRDIVTQLLIENILLCLAGGVLGLLCAQGMLHWLEGSGLVPYLKVSLNFAVLGYGLLITLVFGLLSGVLPAWKMARLDPVRALKGAL